LIGNFHLLQHKNTLILNLSLNEQTKLGFSAIYSYYTTIYVRCAVLVQIRAWFEGVITW